MATPKISTQPDIRKLVSQFLAQTPSLYLDDGSRHVKVRSSVTQDFVLVPFSPSDHRAVKSLRAQLRRLAATGHGLMFARGRLAAA
ncbi:hypothetical protein Thi970DRAFT_00164 [Thiorhodovibrio frisius]|uniref:Uncharacterized protein n=1 Tax=Thiorhodovibrio frisius TaxID=631362 RepID=H8YVT3_9GAMM|nr:hypothetical protein Thi970DRAFT_00164 [Thiorhodovibrio frisius]